MCVCVTERESVRVRVRERVCVCVCVNPTIWHRLMLNKSIPCAASTSTSLNRLTPTQMLTQVAINTPFPSFVRVRIRAFNATNCRSVIHSMNSLFQRNG